MKNQGLSGMLKATASKAKKKDVYSATPPTGDKPGTEKPVEKKKVVKKNVEKKKVVKTSTDDNLTFKQKKKKLKQDTKLNKLEKKANMTDEEKKNKRKNVGKGALSVLGGIATASQVYNSVKGNIKN